MMAMRDRLDSTGHSFQAYFKRATSPLVVLRLLMEKPMYGYELTQEMKQRSGGAFTISVLYPVLYRLQEQGYVEITRSEVVDNRNRSYYAITPAGEDYLRRTWREYLEITKIFGDLMKGVRGE